MLEADQEKCVTAVKLQQKIEFYFLQTHTGDYVRAELQSKPTHNPYLYKWVAKFFIFTAQSFHIISNTSKV